MRTGQSRALESTSLRSKPTITFRPHSQAACQSGILDIMRLTDGLYRCGVLAEIFRNRQATANGSRVGETFRSVSSWFSGMARKICTECLHQSISYLPAVETLPIPGMVAHWLCRVLTNPPCRWLTLCDLLIGHGELCAARHSQTPRGATPPAGTQ